MNELLSFTFERLNCAFDDQRRQTFVVCDAVALQIDLSRACISGRPLTSAGQNAEGIPKCR